MVARQEAPTCGRVDHLHGISLREHDATRVQGPQARIVTSAASQKQHILQAGRQQRISLCLPQASHTKAPNDSFGSEPYSAIRRGIQKAGSPESVLRVCAYARHTVGKRMAAPTHTNVHAANTCCLHTTCPDSLGAGIEQRVVQLEVGGVLSHGGVPARHSQCASQCHMRQQ